MKRLSTAVILPALVCHAIRVFAQDFPSAPVADAMLQDPDPADWLMWRRTLNHWGHSPLDEIDGDNVGDLQLAWSRPLHSGVQDGTPPVYDGVMYFPNPSDVIQAMNAATGELLWEYARALPTDLNVYFPVPGINRNLAVYGNLIINTSADDYLFALDMATGEPVWEHLIMDYRAGAQHTSGPIIADGKVVSGRGCEPEGGPDACIIMAHDAASGEELWRTRTIPAPGEPGGGLVFGGDAAGRFWALDQVTGDVLWVTDLGSQVTGYPVTFAADGKQYVAASTGGSLTVVGLNRLAGEDWQAGTDTNLYVFALPD